MQRYRVIFVILTIGAGCVTFQVHMHSQSKATPLMDPPSEPHALLAAAEKISLSGNWLGAGPYYARAKELFGRRNDERNRLFCELSLLRANLEYSSLPAIANQLHQLLENSSVQRDPRLLLRALIAKGDVDFQLDPAESYRTWTQVSNLASTLNDSMWKNRAAGELGAIEFYRGNIFHALALVGKALLAAEVNRDIGAQIHLCAVLGEGFLEAHRYPDALNFFEHAINLANSAGGAEPPFTAQLGRARALLALKQTEEGISALRRILADSTRRNLRVRQARALSSLSDYYAERDPTSVDALRTFQRGYEMAAQNGLQRLKAQSAARLAQYYAQHGNRSLAERYGEQCVEAARQADDIYNLPDALAVLADLQVSNDHFHQADQTYQEALDRIDGLLAIIPSFAVRNAMIGQFTPVYNDYLRLAITKLKQPDKAFKIIERPRLRAIDDFIVSGRTAEPKMNRTFEVQLRNLNWRLRTEAQPDVRRRLTAALWETEKRATTIIPSPARAGQSETVSLKDIQLALTPSEVLVVYALSNPVSFALAITRDSRATLSLPGANYISPIAEALSFKVRRQKSIQPEATQLYRGLIAEIPPAMLRKEITIIPDVNLSGIPFEVLTNRDSRYLIEDHAVSYAPSVTALYWLRDHGHRKPLTSGFLGVGGVRYSREFALTRGGDPGGIFSASFLPHFSQLFSSTDEVLDVSHALPAPSNTVLVGDDATEKRFKNLSLDHYSTIHFAVHTSVDTLFPERSALILGDAPSSTEDGLLQAREITSLHLNAKLVVLSACSTAVGYGQGLAALAHLGNAFLTAGANNVLGTDWPIDDEMTSQIMRAFYRHLSAGQPIVDALQVAKLDIIHKFGPAAAPYYWAGFRLIGDGVETISTREKL
jgi:CHAT domain-containing protein